MGGAGGAGGARRSSFCVVLSAEQKASTVDVSFGCVNLFFPARRDILRNSSAAAASCVLKF